MAPSPRHLLVVLVAVGGGAATTLIGPSGIASACAQVPETPDLIPSTLTVGPVDPACQRAPDTDKDGVFDVEDNCHRYFNPMQVDTDGDAGPPPYEPVPVNFRDPVTGGDSCDVDDDGDGRFDVEDVCPKVADPEQRDSDGDGLGDACDPTTDAVAAAPPAAASAAPRLTVAKLPAKVRRAEIGAGLAVGASCTVACALQADLRVGRTVLGSTLGGLQGKGRTFLFLKLSGAAKKRLKAKGRLRATVTVVASDDIGRTSTVTRRITLLR